MSLKDHPSLWCLYHTVSGRQLQGLLFDEVRAIASSMTGEEQAKWIVWKEGWPDWRGLKEHEGLVEFLQRPLSIASPPPVPETFVNDPSVSNSVIDDHLSVLKPIETEAPPTLEKFSTDEPIINLVDNAIPFESVSFVARKSQRFNKTYEVTILFGGQQFKTQTIDVSVGGLRLKEPLPSWVGLQFKLRIKRPGAKNQIELLAYRLQSKHDSNTKYRVGFLPLKNERDEANLETWLKAA